MWQYFRLYLSTLLCLWGTVSASAQSLSDKVSKAFETFEADPQLAFGVVSLSVIDANTGEIVFSKGADKGLATASTLKTITTATAMNILGPDYRYATELQYTGHIDTAGVLHGNLLIKGAGDPTLGSMRYEQSKPEVLLKRWVDAVHRTGIRKITGCVVGDDLLWEGQRTPSGWTWADMGNYYGAGVSALNWRENAFKILLQPGASVGTEVKLLGTKPDRAYLKINNEVLTGAKGTGDKVYGYSAPYSNQILLSGTYGIDLKKEIALSSPDAAYDVALALQTALEQAHVEVQIPATTAYLLVQSGGYLDHQRISIDTYYSPSLKEICYWFNRMSINLYGEALLKTLAMESEQAFSTSEAALFERDYWYKLLDLEPGSLRIVDGSGLSPENRVSTLSMARILNSAKSKPWFDGFYEALPTYNNMKMKSGTIAGVLGYAGYHTNAAGRSLVFSFLVNNYQGGATAMRRKMFRMLDALK